ncbi:MAG: hypothetical protein WCS12_00130 [Acholeplasmataceae bacterium]|jgi:shikimate dehydrogenase|nr:hypothetical protein [Acholeplasmataceae bacterium]MCK9233576.1 hypothetical protein [Acholeplasmataceae bacterium]MCK9288780.1 hypothetical protein [Acholeplasmataceae bacterium]MCK9427314.1 hypothetical protein [Acholeplasmataceae bacterium]
MKLALIGKNISHSYSLKLHRLLKEFYQLKLSYQILDLKADEIEGFLNGGKYQGYNVTTPYKEEVIPYLDRLEGVAKELNVVNTIVYKDGKKLGYNTDYEALKAVVDNLEISGKEVFVLGTGGSAKMVAYLFDLKGYQVTMVSRNKNNKKHFKNVIDYQDLSKINYLNTVVNATPIGSVSFLKNPLLKSKQEIDLVIDLVYNPPLTPLMKSAKRSVNGLEMLIRQAIYSESLWFNKVLKSDQKTIQYIKEVLINE